jgi:tetratricopeptide (TPR) repeat protein
MPVAFLSGAFCLFLAGGTAIAYRDNLWQRIHPMMYGSKEQVMPIRAAAERAWLKVMALDEKQGMDKLRAIAGNLKRDAELLLAQKKYSEAEDSFRRFISYCDELETKELERHQTKQKQTDFQKLRKNVMAERIHQLVPEVWQEAEMMVQSAEKSFNNGSFQDAVMRWDEAARLYENARAIVKHRVMEPAQGRDSFQPHSDDSVNSSEDDSQSSHQ